MIARLVLLLLCLAAHARAEEVARLVYLGLENDPYYAPAEVYTGVSLKDRQRPLAGAQLAFRDTRVLSRALGVSFQLDEILAAEGAALSALDAARTPHPLAILLDLPAAEMQAVLASRRDDEVFINVRDPANHWREDDCAAGLLHTVPSDAMLSDALAQFLRARDWGRVLLLRGPTERDAQQAEAARASLTKFGLELVEEREFEQTNDPRRRDRSNIALLTGSARYDVVWLIDDGGDFGRYVPFSTYSPRPVVGSEGLTPLAWHWAFERYGAPQLNQRFRRGAGRNMTPSDWSGWAAIRAVVDAVSASRSVDPAAVDAALVSEALSVDLYKGVRGNFRDWDGQMRQPILLASHNAVIAVAPIEGFEHRVDTLDTLGVDRAETRCRR
ncbi:amino acid ABC transporter substrate-binding protein [Salipiger mangrovisoli]|uniref:Amino acid ABC transporter substrate-binding protein n=1 Tax=Salipiger mangrovisoli TaxID=2865933 RepID=A0ABR9X074_9RHOB|nr:amino acid ABC transporter substrate-binding protein [Salipiger mangrovisoli]MBE9636949.1 amino acid ABC transporter substrate-binding protein [Salipiger mangrovisoli]